jgi:general secretion pathway protein N
MPPYRPTLILAGTGIGLYLLFLIYLFPASLGWNLAPQSLKSQVQLSGLQGSIWSGTASRVMINNSSAGKLEWQLSPWSLLLGRISTDIQLVRNQELIEGHVALTAGGRLAASDLNLRLNGETLGQLTSPYLLHGNIEGNISILTYQQGKVIQASGKVLLTDANIEGPQSLILGQVNADIEPESDGSIIKFKNLGSPMDIKGTLKLNGNGNYRINLGVLNRDSKRQDIKEALKVFGKPDATGRIQLTYYGKLGFHQAQSVRR